jgi:hypothetical protein
MRVKHCRFLWQIRGMNVKRKCPRRVVMLWNQPVHTNPEIKAEIRYLGKIWSKKRESGGRTCVFPHVAFANEQVYMFNWRTKVSEELRLHFEYRGWCWKLRPTWPKGNTSDYFHVKYLKNYIQIVMNFPACRQMLYLKRLTVINRSTMQHAYDMILAPDSCGAWK